MLPFSRTFRAALRRGRLLTNAPGPISLAAGPAPLFKLTSVDTVPFKFQEVAFKLSKSKSVAQKLLKEKPAHVAVVLAKSDFKFAPHSKVGMLAEVKAIDEAGHDVIVTLQGLKRIKTTDESAPEGYILYEDLQELMATDRDWALKYSLINVYRELGPHFDEDYKELDTYQLWLEQVIDICFGQYAKHIDASIVERVLCEQNIEERAISALESMRKLLELKSIEGLARKNQPAAREKLLEFNGFEFGKVKKGNMRLEKYEKVLKVIKKINPTVASQISFEVQQLKNSHGLFNDNNASEMYLNWATGLPWGVYSTNNLDLQAAREKLDFDHYGMSVVKDQIMEFLAVSQLSQKCRGKILCLAGPPGVGKTSIAKSIADALGRKFTRISLGGVDSATHLKGHKKTYIASEPGMIIHALKAAGTMNPVILLDEIEKTGRSNRGDPQWALLEILDPSQNHNFIDTYLDFPIDLSQVFFITTANDLDAISRPLLDRLEILMLPGYTTGEKMAIASHHIIPKAIVDSGLKPDFIQFTDGALRCLIDDHCREPGVRNLQKKIDQICKNVVHSVCLETHTECQKLTAEDLEKYLGKPIAKETHANVGTSGYVHGLYASENDGGVLPVEATLIESEKREMVITGNLKKTIIESSNVAKSFCLAFLRSKGLEEAAVRLETHGVHVHFPGTDVSKDGPSAGITMVTSIISAAIKVPARTDVAMTGAISLNGRVLPIGGVQAKCLGALRNGISTVIIPKGNAIQVEEMPKDLKDELKIHLVENYSEVYEILFKTVEQEAENCVSV